MSNVAHVRGLRSPRVRSALVASAVAAGVVLCSAVLLLVGVAPARGGDSGVGGGPSDLAPTQPQTTQPGDPRTDRPSPAPTKSVPATGGHGSPSDAPETSESASSAPEPKHKGPRARPAAALSPASPSPVRAPAGPGNPAGGFAPNRVPDVGTQPSVAGVPSPAPSEPSEMAAGRASFLPGQEFGVKIFVAGLVALIVSIGGLVTLAIRRRQY